MSVSACTVAVFLLVQAQPAPQRDPGLDAVVARVADYLAGYEKAFRAVVAEERYDQMARTHEIPQPSTDVRRRLRSDFLMVVPPGGTELMPFRDVFEVDGEPVRDRTDRLRRLFLESPSSAIRQGMLVTEESARYNIGGVDRSVNLPTLPLLLLRPTNLSRIAIEKRGEETVGGVRVWKLEFAERAGPTLIRNGRGTELPCSGALWVDPETGRIVKTLIESRDDGLEMKTTVVYAPNEALGIWVPAEMTEVYIAPGQRIEGRAIYTNFRRFQVETDTQVKVPKQTR